MKNTLQEIVRRENKRGVPPYRIAAGANVSVEVINKILDGSDRLNLRVLRRVAKSLGYDIQLAAIKLPEASSC